VLEITLPDHVYLDEYAIIEAGRPIAILPPPMRPRRRE
jgi:hypothetical protein